jgi:hypothetical protein
MNFKQDSIWMNQQLRVLILDIIEIIAFPV